MATSDPLFAIDSKLPADTVEWCPFEGYKNIALCGTYKLHREEQNANEEGAAPAHSNRLGTIFASVLAKDFSNDDKIKCFVGTEIHTSSAVLDVKWCPIINSNQPVISLAMAEGCLQLWKMQSIEDGLVFSHLNTVLLRTEGTSENLALSLDWSSFEGTTTACASDSEGCVSLFHLRESSLEISSRWKAHDLEAWTASFNRHEKNMIFSGGDDSRLKVWDVRQSSNKPAHIIKSHSAGVCSIQSSPKDAFIVASGSYDERLLLWDTRQLSSPLSDSALGGGVWRIKWDAWQAKWLAIACMYSGCAVVDVASLTEPSVVQKYTKHQSIAYGIDWCSLLPHQLPVLDEASAQCFKMGLASSCSCKSSPIIASCSFYDSQLHFWNPTVTF